MFVSVSTLPATAIPARAVGAAPYTRPQRRLLGCGPQVKRLAAAGMGLVPAARTRDRREAASASAHNQPAEADEPPLAGVRTIAAAAHSRKDVAYLGTCLPQVRAVRCHWARDHGAPAKPATTPRRQLARATQSPPGVIAAWLAQNHTWRSEYFNSPGQASRCTCPALRSPLTQNRSGACN